MTEKPNGPAERFRADPNDRITFEALEERLFLDADWHELIALYEVRLTADDLREDAAGTRKLRFRMGQILEERCDDLDRALAVYEEVVRLDPGFRPALAQLRRIHSSRGAWDLALQVAELEEQTEMAPFERAVFCVEMGDLWRDRLEEPEKARALYESALEADPRCAGAQLGLADVQEELSRFEEAASLRREAIENLQGTQRAEALSGLARLYLGPLDDSDQAEELLRRALSDDARCDSALEALCYLAIDQENWELAGDLFERRYFLAPTNERRAAIAGEAGELQLTRLRNPQGARLWFERMRELLPDDPKVYLRLASIESLAGHEERERGYLERAAALGDEALPADDRARLAELLGDDPGAAVEQLQEAVRLAPGNRELRSSLADALEEAGRYNELVLVLEEQKKQLEPDDEDELALVLRLATLKSDDLGRPEAARPDYERAFEIDPSRGGSAAFLESNYRAQGAWSKLREILETVCERGPESRRIDARVSLGELLFEHFDEAEGAREAFETALDAEPSHPAALRGLERVAAATGDEDSIVEAFEREARVTTDRDRLAFLVGELVRIHESHERFEEALPWVERQVASSPEDRDALRTRARLQQRLGRDDDVRETLERLDVLLTGGEQAENRRRLGAFYRDAGEDDRAIVAYQGALSADPEDKAALAELLHLLTGAERWEELADVRRELAEHLDGDARRSCLLELAELLQTRLDQGEVAITVLSALAEEWPSDDDIETRLDALLEEHAHFEELLERLASRRATRPDDDPTGRELDRRRAELLLDELRRPADAATLLHALHDADPDDAHLTETLERALRAAGDSPGLCAVLEKRAAEADDPEAAARLEFERAAILEDTLGELDQARAIYEDVASGTTELVRQAEAQIDRLLEQTGDWQTLRERLEERILGASSDAAGHDRLADLCRDRLNDREAAKEHLERAVDIDPSEPRRWQALARLFEEDSNFEKVLGCIEGELEHVGDDRQRELVLRSRAAELCLREMQDPTRAAAHYRRILVLDPTDAAAAEFLVEQLEENREHGALAALLTERLERLTADAAAGGGEAEASLRLRIAALRAGPLDDPEGAIAVLEPVASSSAQLGLVAEPLADLYHRTDRLDALAQLASRAAEQAGHPSERANWLLRLGDTKRAEGDDTGAAEAYRDVLSIRPDDHGAQSALRDIYRRLGEPEPLAHLLEAELSQIGGPDEIPVRLELAALLEGALARPEDALVHIQRVLQLENHHPVALDRALALCRHLDRREERLAFLERSLSLTRSPSQRAHRLSERGELLMELERFDEAVACYEQALEIDPSDLSKNHALRSALECVGDYEGVLRCVAREAAALPLEERARHYEEAAGIAEEHLTDVETLAWLERLRAARPEDALVLSRIAAVHERANRPEAVLRAHEAELALSPSDERRCELQVARAEIYESALNAPGRAIGALEAARQTDPRGREVLRRLARLYEVTGRTDARADALEALLEEADPGERAGLRKDLASLCSGALSNPERAINHLWAALTEHQGSQVERIEILSHLGSVFRAVRRTDLWARVAEEELRSLHPEEPVFAERRNGLHRDLARSYARELGRLDAAVPHWRALVAADELEDGTPGEAIVEEAELELLSALRALRSHVELERRLALRLERHPAEPALWLELGRLRAEQLHRPAAAAEAFRKVLEHDPESLPAIRGLRAVVQRLGQWEEAAATLQMEIDLPHERGPNQLAALFRRQGDICWHHLDSTTRASRAFAAALEADPSDLRALRSLQKLFETMEDWRGLYDLFESEIEILGDNEPNRRQEIWLHAGALCRDRLDDGQRALRAYEAASAVAALPCDELRAFAELYHDAGRYDRFCQVFESWCDAPDSEPDAEDHLRLARVFEEQSDLESARRHAERATECSPSLVAAWDALATLRERLGDVPGAAMALENGAARLTGAEAARRNHHAAELVREHEPERAFTLFEKSLANDPARSVGHAALAEVSSHLGRDRRAMEHAERALSLVGPDDDFPEADRLETALIGGRAARRVGELDAAARLFRTALEHHADHAEALATRGEILVELGDHAEAGRALRRRLELDEEDPERATHLALLGGCLEATDAPEQALRCFREALEIEPGLDGAFAGTVRLLEATEDFEAAIATLREWADRTADPSERSSRLFHAGELELDRLEREEPGESLLREAVAADPSQGGAWVRLAQLLWEQQRSDDALDVATQGLDATGDALGRADLAWVRGCALEQQGERGAAADAFRVTMEADPARAPAALQAAKLLRALGEWRSAAQALTHFYENFPGEDRRALAPVLNHLGRLLAGPLEDLDRAIEMYREALACDPSLDSARASLAELLAHRPDEWEEALERHAELLNQNPARVASLRAVVGMARRRGLEGSVGTGLAILGALGAATPEEIEEAPRNWLPEVEPAVLEDSVWEAVRRAAREASEELGQALGTGSPDFDHSKDTSPRLRFRAAVTSAEAELSAPALVPLPVSELSAALVLLRQLAFEEESVTGDGHLVNELSAHLGRRARKRIRRVLEDVDGNHVAEIDYTAWRAELRGLAGTLALRESRVSLRDALSALLLRDEDQPERTLPPEADFEALVAGSPEALAMLRQLVRRWIAGL